MQNDLNTMGTCNWKVVVLAWKNTRIHVCTVPVPLDASSPTNCTSHLLTCNMTCAQDDKR